MYKQHLLDNIEREYSLLKQLIPLIDENDLDFRPTEKVRSALEIMQYLSTVGATMLRWFLINDLTPQEFVKIRTYRQTLTLSDFAARLDKQLEEIRAYFDTISEKDLLEKEIELPWKEKMILGKAIINCPIKWLATYRMELFMYLKINKGLEISTKEAWQLQ